MFRFIKPSLCFPTWFDHRAFYSQNTTDIAEDILSREKAAWQIVFYLHGLAKGTAGGCVREQGEARPSELAVGLGMEREHSFVEQVLLWWGSSSAT